MALLTQSEFAQMEHLLANLLDCCNADEELALLRIHGQLRRIHDTQKELQDSHEHLTVILEEAFHK